MGKKDKEKDVSSEMLLKALRSSDTKDYIRYWIENNSMVYLRGGLWRYDDAILRYDEMRNKLLVDYQIDRSIAAKRVAKLNEDLPESVHRGPKKVSKDMLFAAADEVIRLIKHEKLTQTRKRLAYDPQADPEMLSIKNFVANLTTTNVDLSVAVIHHYIRMAKRRLFDLPVENHIIPVIIGPQGKGKSENVNRLLSPLKEYLINLPDVTHLTDSRNYHAFSEYYLGVIDEMPRLQKADIDKVKTTVTMPLLSSRTLGTHNFSSVPNNLTIIGTSNTRLKYQSLDSTGMRRFYELINDKEIDRQISESIDYEKLWRSIDENAPSPLSAFMSQLQEHQEDLRPLNYIELFFEEYHINLSKPLDFKVDVRYGMYDAIKQWAKITGNEGPWLRDQTMKNMLEQHGLKQSIISGKKVFKVNADCMLNPLYANGFSESKLTEKDVQEIESLPQLQKMIEAALAKEDYFMAARIQERIREVKSQLSGNVFNL